MKRLTVIAALATLVVACSPVRFVPLAESRRPSLRANQAVDVVVTGKPKCAYDEIGLLRVHARSLEDALNLMRDKARSIGAPMLILRSPTQPIDGSRTFEAVAVLPDCDRLVPMPPS
jgi:hypothetical protein